MDKRSIVVGCLVLVVLSAGVLAYALRDRKVSIEQYTSIDRTAGIHPDYCGIVVPPNIAPLNFVVLEDGSYYCVRISSKQGRTIEVFSRSPKIVIPEDPWHELLSMNPGQQLSFDVFVKTIKDTWQRFQTITNRIAGEEIDGFLVYRRIHPGYSTWGKMGVYQRNLQNHDESLVLNNGYYGDGCLNCHTFCQNHPDKMLIGIRSSIYGSSALLVEDGTAKKIGTKFGYTSWHPSGRLATYSINNIRLFFHSAKDEVRGVTDLDSLLAYYLLDSKTIKTSPQFSKKDRLETYPTWSPDGRYLYFCSAPILWSQRDTVPQENYDQVKYDLVRISYDLERDEWGELETVLSAKDTHLTILMPRISPDGRWLLFCMCDYGSFPVYHDSSDLYMIDLDAFEKTGHVKPLRLKINSDKSESWHSWSGNSRWIAFSSKKQSGVFTRCYISYVDQKGETYKPFLLPQKDPTYYDSCLWTYSVPELINKPVRVTGEKLGRLVRGSRKISVNLPITMATPKPGVVPGRREQWQERE
ncbi:MAG: TolB family protein [Planctomycetota bacterium]|jgi:hypothetical protein